MRDLMLSLPQDLRPRAALEQALRTAIRSGQLLAGAELPSTRSLAADLNLSRSTVVAAYEQLAVEGYLRARQGRATTVADVSMPSETDVDERPHRTRPAFDFRNGEPSAGSFPRTEWRKSMRTVLDTAADEAFGYGDPRGRFELRAALADYLARARVVHGDASSVRIYAGFASALGFIGGALRRIGVDRVAVEQPMLYFHRQILELTGVTTVPITVDGEGLRVDELNEADVRAVLVTPSNQQPLGVTMSPVRRAELVEWAAAVDGWIIEDDYDGEFRYDRRPIAALQGLDPDRVLYAGTASKSMAPGLHLSWLVVPSGLRRSLRDVTHLRAGVSTLNQLALADFIERGAYDRHIRKRRRVYDGRSKIVVDRLQDFEHLKLAPHHAGMHIVAALDTSGPSEQQVLAMAADASVGLLGLQAHFGHDEPGLVINVARPADHEFASAVESLVHFFRNVQAANVQAAIGTTAQVDGVRDR